MRFLAASLAAALCLGAAPAAVAASLTIQLKAHVPEACWMTEAGPRCNTPPAAGAQAEGFGAQGRLQAMTPRLDERGWLVRSYVAF